MTYGAPDRGHPVWSLDEESSRPLIAYALEAGINFFDTANLYSYGSSEEILGRALKDYAHRDDVVITTKVRHAMRPLCADEGIAITVWSPLARGRLARPFDLANSGTRAATDGGGTPTCSTGERRQ